MVIDFIAEIYSVFGQKDIIEFDQSKKSRNNVILFTCNKKFYNVDKLWVSIPLLIKKHSKETIPSIFRNYDISNTN